jgi:hypothetical protein
MRVVFNDIVKWRKDDDLRGINGGFGVTCADATERLFQIVIGDLFKFGFESYGGVAEHIHLLRADAVCWRERGAVEHQRLSVNLFL